METFCTASTIAIAWALSLYLTYHFGRNMEYRHWASDYLKRQKSLYDSPWYWGGS